jgi:DNA-binding GntR family transcriptional regulator
MALAQNTDSSGLVRPVDLSHAVTAAVRELIMTGAVLPGERLVETELSERFGTSRGPVRDAFKELEQSGLVVSIPRRGTFVATLTASDIDEIYTLRLALERLAITTTATVATDEDIAEMRAAVDHFNHAQRTGDRRAGAEADIAIHRLIVRTAGHERLTEAWERLADQTLLLMAELMDLLLDVQHAAGDHDELVNAIAAKNAAGAEAALTDHLQAARQAMIANAPASPSHDD